MAKMNEIYIIAKKWQKKFKDPDVNVEELLDNLFADDFERLGCEVDCGHSFAEEYGSAACDSRELKRILYKVYDIPLLVSAIYSQWRYFSRLSYDPRSIAAPENIEWFVLALGRLAALAKEEVDELREKEWAREGEEYDRVNRVTVDYQHIRKYKPDHDLPNQLEYLTWEYSEKLLVDRESQSMELIQFLGDGDVISKKYLIKGLFESILDCIDPDFLFGVVEGNAPDVVEDPLESRPYTITVDFEKAPQYVIQGNYDKNELPEYWEEFACRLSASIQSYEDAEILDPSIYRKEKRRRQDYRYCSVIFGEGYKSYYYIADDDSIEVGDRVLVLVGKNTRPSKATVVDEEFFSAENAPIPPEKTKHILRKCTEEELDESEDF